jgi:NAD(P)-dependent dehydrogenase (short-subunit alcohol dehydrogenase family)
MTTATRNWFITGISSGIGQALANAVLARGERVVGTARNPAALTAFEHGAPGRAHGFLLDVDRTADIAPIAQRALEAIGRIDIVVNNAGRSLFGAVEEATPAEAQALFATNFLAPLAVMQAFLPHFRARGTGHFVNVSSGCGLMPVPGVGIYCASKFALEGLSETLALEVAGFGIGMTLVEPGAVKTRFISHGTRDTARRDPAYAALSGGGKAALDAYYDSIAIPPVQVAEAILEAMDRSPPPLHLIVGEDVRASVRQRLQTMLEYTS